MALEDYFDRIFCINLKSRTDRWEECKREFKKQKIRNVVRVEGVQGQPPGLKEFGDMGVAPSEENAKQKLAGRIGCLMSHLKVIKMAKKDRLKTILILEDDIQFVPEVQLRFADVYRKIPQRWSLLYLGGNEKGIQQQVNECVVQVSNMLMAHAIGIHFSIYDELIERLSECSLPVDVYYAQFQREYPCFALHPYLAWQRASWSDIEQRFRIYDLENMAPFLQEMLKPKIRE